MANVKFFRGLKANLPQDSALTSALEGAFYLTTDSQQLYNVIAKSGGGYTLIPLGENITQFSSTATVGGAADYPGQFAYVKNGNIFMVSVPDGTGYKWVQVNSQSAKVTGNSLTAITESSTVKIQSVISDSESGAYTGKLAVKGSGAASVSIDTDGALLITVPVATLTAESVTSGAKLKVGSGAESIVGDGDTTKVTYDSTNHKITVAANKINALKGFHDNDTDGTAVAKSTTAGEGFAIQVGDSESHTATGYLNPVIKTLDTNDAGVKFLNGTATINTYSKAQIDALKIQANAMTYKGTVGTGGTVTDLPTSQVCIGDTYKLLQSIASISGSKKGDLVIANGTEDPSTGYITGTITWDLVPSGDDVDDYTLNFVSGSHKWYLDRASTNAGAVQLIEGAKIKLADGGSASAGTITISHDDIGAVDGTVTSGISTALEAATSECGSDVDIYYTFGVQTVGTTTTKGLEVDAKGHLASIKTKKLTIKGNKLDSSNSSDTLSVSAAGSASTVGGTATLKDTWKVQDVSTAYVQKDHSISLSSNTLAVSASVSGGVGTYNVDLIWGTF